LVPPDLETGDLAQSLSTSGFRWDRPVIVVWEAVTQYLTEDAVRHTIAVLADAAPTSRLIFTFVRQDFLAGSNTYQAERAYQGFVLHHQIWHFGLSPDQVGLLLDEYGWAEQDQVGAAEFRQRYLQPVGRELAVSEIERFAAAVK
jgi:methyltransferase (TIGR00027 family)